MSATVKKILGNSQSKRIGTLYFIGNEWKLILYRDLNTNIYGFKIQDANHIRKIFTFNSRKNIDDALKELKDYTTKNDPFGFTAYGKKFKNVGKSRITLAIAN